MDKYARLRARARRERHRPTRVSCMNRTPRHGPTSLRVHTPDYVARVRDGGLTREEQRRIGFPWSLQMVERSRRSVEGPSTRPAPRCRTGSRPTSPAARTTRSGIAARATASSTTSPLPPRRCSRHGRVRQVAVDRSRRAPGQRHGGDLRARPACLHLLAARRRQLPVPQGTQRPRRAAARWHRRR